MDSALESLVSIVVAQETFSEIIISKLFVRSLVFSNKFTATLLDNDAAFKSKWSWFLPTEFLGYDIAGLLTHVTGQL